MTNHPSSRRVTNPGGSGRPATATSRPNTANSRPANATTPGRTASAALVARPALPTAPVHRPVATRPPAPVEEEFAEEDVAERSAPEEEEVAPPRRSNPRATRVTERSMRSQGTRWRTRFVAGLIGSAAVVVIGMGAFWSELKPLWTQLANNQAQNQALAISILAGVVVACALIASLMDRSALRALQLAAAWSAVLSLGLTAFRHHHPALQAAPGVAMAEAALTPVLTVWSGTQAESARKVKEAQDEMKAKETARAELETKLTTATRQAEADLAKARDTADAAKQEVEATIAAKAEVERAAQDVAAAKTTAETALAAATAEAKKAGDDAAQAIARAAQLDKALALKQQGLDQANKDLAAARQALEEAQGALAAVPEVPAVPEVKATKKR